MNSRHRRGSVVTATLPSYCSCYSERFAQADTGKHYVGISGSAVVSVPCKSWEQRYYELSDYNARVESQVNLLMARADALASKAGAQIKYLKAREREAAHFVRKTCNILTELYSEISSRPIDSGHACARGSGPAIAPGIAVHAGTSLPSQLLSLAQELSGLVRRKLMMNEEGLKNGRVEQQRLVSGMEARLRCVLAEMAGQEELLRATDVEMERLRGQIEEREQQLQSSAEELVAIRREKDDELQRAQQALETARKQLADALQPSSDVTSAAESVAWLKARLRSVIAEMAGQEELSVDVDHRSTESTHSHGACSAFRLDLSASFGRCICGHAKSSHSTSAKDQPITPSSRPHAAVASPGPSKASPSRAAPTRARVLPQPELLGMQNAAEIGSAAIQALRSSHGALSSDGHSSTPCVLSSGEFGSCAACGANLHVWKWHICEPKMAKMSTVADIHRERDRGLYSYKDESRDSQRPRRIGHLHLSLSPDELSFVSSPLLLKKPGTAHVDLHRFASPI